jgi:hypothetical protein
VGTLRKSMVVLNLDVKAQKATLLKTIPLDVDEVENAFIFKSSDGRTFVAVSSGNLLHAAPLGKLEEARDVYLYVLCVYFYLLIFRLMFVSLLQTLSPSFSLFFSYSWRGICHED